MRKQYIFLAVVLVLLAGVSGLAAYKYNEQPKGITVTEAVHQRDTALIDLQVAKQLDATHKQAATNQITDLTTANKTLTAQNTTLCTQIKAAKLVQPICK